ncbi:hypothetical protein BDF22DRAFT_740822 [Syncephalis plumigaleata]|nr:hypothetical protein BDF22DRAFT_740822 [Syncephalis plumigaleata]
MTQEYIDDRPTSPVVTIDLVGDNDEDNGSGSSNNCPPKTSTLRVSKSRKDLNSFTEAINREIENERREDAGEDNALLTHSTARGIDFQQCMERSIKRPAPINTSAAIELGPRSLSATATPELDPSLLSPNSALALNRHNPVVRMSTDPVTSTGDANQRDTSRRNPPGIRTWRSSSFLNMLFSFTGRKSKQVTNSSPSAPTSPMKTQFSTQISSTTTHTMSTATSVITQLTEETETTDRLDSNSYVTESTGNTLRGKTISEDDGASSSHDSAMARIPLWPPIAPMNTECNTAGSSSGTRPIRVAIIGGSYAGLAAARELDAVAEQYNLHITVIDPRTHLFFNVGFLRSIVIDISRLCFVPTDNVFASGRVHHCRTRALHLERRHIVLEQWTEEQEAKYRKEASKQANGGNIIQSRMEPPPAVIPYDYAIIAAGSHYPPPMKLAVESMEEGLRDLAQVRAAIQRSQRILVVGGGPSGVEVASEIMHYHPDKEVTIIHNTDQLVDGLGVSRKVHQHIERSLRHLGVKIRLKEALLLTEAQRLRGFIEETCVYTTNQGNSIETDLLFICAGNVRYNTKLVEKLASSTLEEVINSKGEIHVLPTLQLVPYPHIFAIGDCCDAAPAKLAVAAIDQSRVCVRNVVRLVQHRRAYEAEQQQQQQAAAKSSSNKNCNNNNNNSNGSSNATAILGEMESYEHIDATANLVRYQNNFKFVLSLGPNDGVGVWPYLGVMPGWMAKRFKSRSLMMPVIYRTLNVPFPSKARTF